MNDLKIIEQRTVLGKDFKIYGDYENPLFLAKDVAEWIDYAYKDSRKMHRDVSKMLSMVDDDEKSKSTLKLGGEDYSHGGIRENTEMWFLTEDGLYEVLMQSRKPIAKKFKKQVKAILKDIRKFGVHATDELLNNPDFLIDALQALKKEREEKAKLQAANQEQRQKIELDKPKVLFAESVQASEQSILVGQLAKLIRQNGYEIGQNRLFAWLRDKGYLIKRGQNYNQPTQKSMELGLMEVKERSIVNPDGSTRITMTTKITGKGQVYFVNKFVA